MMSNVARWVLSLGLALGGMQLGVGCIAPVADDGAELDALDEDADFDEFEEEAEKGIRRFNGLVTIPGLDRGQGLGATLGLKWGDSLWKYERAMKSAGLDALFYYTRSCAKSLKIDRYQWCDSACAESISACLMALTNVHGEERDIELVSGSIGALRGDTSLPNHEGTYFGDILGDRAEAYVTITRYPYRSCAKGACAFNQVSDSACAANHSQCKHKRTWNYPIAVYMKENK